MGISTDRITMTEGLISSARTAATASVTVTATDVTLIRCSYTATGAVAVALPALSGVTDGKVIVIMDTGGNASINNITITPNGANTIIGDATYTISGNDESVYLVANPATGNWEAI